MPTQVTRYRCDLCDEEYDSEEEAQACEDLGTPIRTVPGFLFSHVAKPGVVVAVATYERHDKHYASWTGWLCEPDKPIVGPLSGPRLSKKTELTDPRQHPDEYARMVAHVREQLPDARLMYFDGEWARDIDQ
jgi:hypothetical protein